MTELTLEQIGDLDVKIEEYLADTGNYYELPHISVHCDKTITLDGDFSVEVLQNIIGIIKDES